MDNFGTAGESVWFTTFHHQRTPLRVGVNFGHGISWVECHHDLNLGLKLLPSLEVTPVESDPSLMALSFRFGSCHNSASSMLLVKLISVTICTKKDSSACQGKFNLSQY